MPLFFRAEPPSMGSEDTELLGDLADLVDRRVQLLRRVRGADLAAQSRLSLRYDRVADA
jgi:hypothetical protein